MKIPFTKMHGAGNDYVYVNGFALQIPDPAALARVVSLRRKGIGSDGLILVQPSSVAAVRMEMYNADGSRGEMCGNGIRCVGKYAWEHGLARENPLRVETDAGIKTLELEISNGQIYRRKMFVVKNRVFILIATAPRDDPKGGNAYESLSLRFINSFKFLEHPAQD